MRWRTFFFSLAADADDIDSSTVLVQYENTTVSDSVGAGLLVKWAPPPDPNGFIVSYQVEYKMVSQEKVGPWLAPRNDRVSCVRSPTDFSDADNSHLFDISNLKEEP